jgi:hypothetical protein
MFATISGWLGLRAVVLATMVLTALTALMMQPDARFEVIGGELLRNGDFAAGEAAWQGPWTDDGTRQDGQVLTVRTDTPRPLLFRQIVERPAGVAFVRLTFDARYHDIRGPTKSWHRALVSVIQRDGAGRERWEYPFQAMRRLGSKDWDGYREFFHLPADTVAMRLVFGLNVVAGEMSVRNFSMVPVRERPAFRFVRGAIIAAWLLLAAATLNLMLRRRGWYRRGAVALVAVAILTGALTPHQLKSQIFSMANNFFSDTGTSPTGAPSAASVKPAPPPVAKAPARAAAPAQPSVFDRLLTWIAGDASGRAGAIWSTLHHVGHVGLFTLLSWSAFWAWWHRPRWRVLALLVGFALVAEVLQALTLDRHPDVFDFARNSSGVLLGFLAALATARLRAWRAGT